MKMVLLFILLSLPFTIHPCNLEKAKETVGLYLKNMHGMSRTFTIASIGMVDDFTGICSYEIKASFYSKIERKRIIGSYSLDSNFRIIGNFDELTAQRYKLRSIKNGHKEKSN